MTVYPNWFASTDAINNFKEILEGYKGQPDLQFLQLGAFTGDASIWLLDNILTNKTSHLTDVDTWEGSDESQHETMDFADVEKVYDKRTKKYKNLTKVKSTTFKHLKAAPYDFYDFIYIDAAHTAIDVLLDAELSHASLKSGGILAFDDYLWSDGKGDHLRPMPGINSFLDRHNNEYYLLAQNWQVWLKKA